MPITVNTLSLSAEDFENYISLSNEVQRLHRSGSRQQSFEDSLIKHATMTYGELFESSTFDLAESSSSSSSASQNVQQTQETSLNIENMFDDFDKSVKVHSDNSEVSPQINETPVLVNLERNTPKVAYSPENPMKHKTMRQSESKLPTNHDWKAQSQNCKSREHLLPAENTTKPAMLQRHSSPENSNPPASEKLEMRTPKVKEIAKIFGNQVTGIVHSSENKKHTNVNKHPLQSKFYTPAKIPMTIRTAEVNTDKCGMTETKRNLIAPIQAKVFNASHSSPIPSQQAKQLIYDFSKLSPISSPKRNKKIEADEICTNISVKDRVLFYTSNHCQNEQHADEVKVKENSTLQAATSKTSKPINTSGNLLLKGSDVAEFSMTSHKPDDSQNSEETTNTEIENSSAERLLGGTLALSVSSASWVKTIVPERQNDMTVLSDSAQPNDGTQSLTEALLQIEIPTSPARVARPLKGKKKRPAPPPPEFQQNRDEKLNTLGSTDSSIPSSSVKQYGKKKGLAPPPPPPPPEFQQNRDERLNKLGSTNSCIPSSPAKLYGNVYGLISIQSNPKCNDASKVELNVDGAESATPLCKKALYQETDRENDSPVSMNKNIGTTVSNSNDEVDYKRKEDECQQVEKQILPTSPAPPKPKRLIRSMICEPNSQPHTLAATAASHTYGSIQLPEENPRAVGNQSIESVIETRFTIHQHDLYRSHANNSAKETKSEVLNLNAGSNRMKIDAKAPHREKTAPPLLRKLRKRLDKSFLRRSSLCLSTLFNKMQNNTPRYSAPVVSELKQDDAFRNDSSRVSAQTIQQDRSSDNNCEETAGALARMTESLIAHTPTVEMQSQDSNLESAYEHSLFWITAGNFIVSIKVFYNLPESLLLWYKAFGRKINENKGPWNLDFGIDSYKYSTSNTLDFERNSISDHLPKKMDCSHYWLSVGESSLPFNGNYMAPDKIKVLFDLVRAALKDHKGELRFGIDDFDFSKAGESVRNSHMEKRSGVLAHPQWRADARCGSSNSNHMKTSDLDCSDFFSENFNSGEFRRTSSPDDNSCHSFGAAVRAISPVYKNPDLFTGPYDCEPLDKLFEKQRLPGRPQVHISKLLEILQSQKAKLEVAENRLIYCARQSALAGNDSKYFAESPYYLWEIQRIIKEINGIAKHPGSKTSSMQPRILNLSNTADICLTNSAHFINQFLYRLANGCLQSTDGPEVKVAKINE